MIAILKRNLADLLVWAKTRVREATTYAGLALSAISEVARQYAAFDQRIAITGMVCGFLLVMLREHEHKDGDHG